MEKKDYTTRTKDALGCLIAVLATTAAIVTCNQILRDTVFNNLVAMILLSCVYIFVFVCTYDICVWLLRKCGVTITEDYLR